MLTTFSLVKSGTFSKTFHPTFNLIFKANCLLFDGKNLILCTIVACYSLSSVVELKLFIFGSGSTLFPYFGSGSSSCHILPLKTVQYYNSKVPLEIYISGGLSSSYSILQTDCSNFLLNRKCRLRLQVSNNFGSTLPAPQH